MYLFKHDRNKQVGRYNWKYNNYYLVTVQDKYGKTIKNNAGKTALDAVSAPFDKVKPVYDNLAKGMAPMGVRFDYKFIEETRPKIADLLK